MEPRRRRYSAINFRWTNSTCMPRLWFPYSCVLLYIASPVLFYCCQRCTLARASSYRCVHISTRRQSKACKLNSKTKWSGNSKPLIWMCSYAVQVYRELHKVKPMCCWDWETRSTLPIISYGKCFLPAYILFGACHELVFPVKRNQAYQFSSLMIE